MSLSIGANKLFKLSKDLEETLNPELFNDLYNQLNIVLNELENNLDMSPVQKEEKSDLLIEDKKEILFQSLLEAIETRRPKKYNVVIDEIKGYRLSDEDSLIFNKICECLENYQFEEALSLIENKV